jgi:hypothetical protein
MEREKWIFGRREKIGYFVEFREAVKTMEKGIGFCGTPVVAQFRVSTLFKVETRGGAVKHRKIRILWDSCDQKLPRGIRERHAGLRGKGKSLMENCLQKFLEIELLTDKREKVNDLTSNGLPILSKVLKKSDR